MFMVICSVCGEKHFGDPPNGWLSSGSEHFCPRHLDRAPAGARPTADLEPDDVGFEGPEDGSEERYQQRRAERPWAAHTLWWVVHNAVAHPLIALFPRRPFFRFHDWTSRKMHGR